MSSQPNYFYRYVPINTFLYQLLINNEFYCPSPKELNDPYDGRFQLTRQFLINLYQEDIFTEKEKSPLFDFIQMYKHMHKIEEVSIEEIADYVFNNKWTETHLSNKINAASSHNILSFSRNEGKDDIIMFAHYCKSSNGVRLKFNFNKDRFNPDLQLIKEVSYTNESFPANDYLGVYNSFLRKTKYWEYEQEWRIVTPSKRFRWNKFMLEEMTFGLNCSIYDRITIRNLCRALKYSCGFNFHEMTAQGIESMQMAEYPTSPMSAFENLFDSF